MATSKTETKSITYTRRYYKSITKDVDVPQGLEGDELNKWLDENVDFDDVHDKSLEFEDDEYFENLL